MKYHNIKMLIKSQRQQFAVRTCFKFCEFGVNCIKVKKVVTVKTKLGLLNPILPLNYGDHQIYKSSEAWQWPEQVNKSSSY